MNNLINRKILFSLCSSIRVNISLIIKESHGHLHPIDIEKYQQKKLCEITLSTRRQMEIFCRHAYMIIREKKLFIVTKTIEKHTRANRKKTKQKT